MWKYHDKKMKELKKIYQRISNQTQNRLQEIFNSVKFDELNSIASNRDIKRIGIYIEEWKAKGLLSGYFGMLANNMYRRSRIRNGEILELLIYSAYIEEQYKLEQEENTIFKDVANYYYIQGQKEVNNTRLIKKKTSEIPKETYKKILKKPNAKRLYLERI